jgi:hypothetical protein
MSDSRSMNLQYQRRIETMNAVIHGPLLDKWQATVATLDSSLLRTMLPILRNLAVEVDAKIAFIEMILDAEQERSPKWDSTFTLSVDGTTSSLASPSSPA